MGKYKATKEQIQKAKEKTEQTKKLSEHIIKDILKNYETDIDKIIGFFKFSSKLYRYSPKNIALIQDQNPHALFCNSFLNWKKLNCNVLKGAHGYTILVPKPVTGFRDENNEFIKVSEATAEQKQKIKNGEIKTERYMYFGTGTVFDVTQTDYPPEKYPALFNIGYTSAEHELLCDLLIDYSEKKLNIPVYIRQIEGIGLNGYYSHLDNSITVADRFKDTQKLSTLAHELGHAIIHNNSDALEKTEALRELEADIFSIYLQSYFDINIIDTRKEHLKECFQQYKIELKFQDKDISEEKIICELEKVLENVYEIYRNHITKINELYLEHEQENQITEDSSVQQNEAGMEL